MSDIIRKIAQQATLQCMENKVNQAWLYEDAVVELVLKECNAALIQEYSSMDVSSDWEDGKICGLVHARLILRELFNQTDDYE